MKPIVEGLRHRFNVAAAEVGYQEQWQRAEIGVAVVSAREGHAVEVLDAVERWVWSRPDVEVVNSERSWAETG